jgi:hypothetical protein
VDGSQITEHYPQIEHSKGKLLHAAKREMHKKPKGREKKCWLLHGNMVVQK